MQGEILQTLTEPVQLVVADDHELVRSGLISMLVREPDLEVVGEASNGLEAIGLCRRVKPKLVLMDVRMPEMDGLTATRRIKEELPDISVLIVTTHDDPDYLLDAMKAGAAGYILKDAPRKQLLNAIRRVINGESPLNQELATQLIRRLAVEAEQQKHSIEEQKKQRGPSLESLTYRELEVLRLLAAGQSNPEIARNLVISRGTAKIHVQHIITKLGVSDRTQAVVKAIELGLLSTGE